MRKPALLFLFLALPCTAYADTMQSSLRQLVQAGQSVSCTYETTDAPPQKGTVYVNGGRMRTDVQMADPDGSGQMLPMHMLRDGDTMYMWGGMLGDTQGMKMKAVGSGSAPNGRGPDLDQEFAMDCNAWTPDEDKFTLPPGIVFNELNTAMNAPGSAGMDMQAMRCLACDQAPPDEQAQCRQIMGCS